MLLSADAAFLFTFLTQVTMTCTHFIFIFNYKLIVKSKIKKFLINEEKKMNKENKQLEKHANM